MTIEQTLDRIATALEQQAEATSQQNALLAALLERAGAVPEAADSNTATKTRRGGKKTETETPPAADQGASQAAAEAQAAAQAQAEAAAQAAAAAAAQAVTPAASSAVPSLEDIQAFATSLASKVTPARVVELIKKTGSTNISSMNEAQRAGFWADIQALASESDAAAALG